MTPKKDLHSGAESSILLSSGGISEPEAAAKAGDMKNLLQSDAANGVLLQKDAVAEIQKKVDGGWADDVAWTYRAHPDEKAEARDLAEVLREFEETIRGADKEIAVVLDQEGRFVAAHGVGKTGGDLTGTDLQGKIVTHNHPGGTLALSDDDTEIILKNGAQEIRAVPRGDDNSFVSLARGRRPDAEGMLDDLDAVIVWGYAIDNDLLDWYAIRNGFIFRKVEK